MSKKNCSWYSKIFVSILFLALLFCSSCDNFLTGDNVVDDLKKVIEYANASKYSVRVQAEEKTGTVISVRNVQVKVTDDFEIAFQPADDYTFLRWEAVNIDDDSISMANYIEIDKPNLLETKVRLIKETNSVLLKPLCEKKFKVTDCTVGNKDLVYCRDAAIVITFNNPISPDVDLSDISVSVSGISDAFSYFKTPSIIDDKLYILPNIEGSGYIPVVQNSSRTVTVSIPKTLYYDGKYERVNLESDYTVSYVIDSSTSEKTKAKYSYDDTVGTLRIDSAKVIDGTEKEYSVGQSINLVYRNNADYYFHGWKIKDFEGNDTDSIVISYPDSEDENGYDQETLTATATLLFIHPALGITISPDVVPIPTSSISVVGEKGRISPNNADSYKELVEVPLSYDPDKDYCFTKWNVKTTTGEDASQYIEIKDVNSMTTSFVVKKNPPENVDFIITPSYVERAQFLSWTPLYSALGVYKDSRIQVMFDHDMDPESIYYTETEQEELKSKYGENCLLPPDEKGNVYGYKYGPDKFYKNITITDSSNRNLLDYYGAPYFTNGNILIVPTYIERNDKDVIRKSPSAGTDVIVTIGEQVFYRENGNDVAVKMSGSKKWNYLVNGDEDSIPPDVKVSLFAKTEYFSNSASDFNETSDNRIESNDNENELLLHKEDWNKYALLDSKLKVYGRFADAGSGVISSFTYKTKQISDGYSPAVHEPVSDTMTYTKGSASAYTFGNIDSDKNIAEPGELDFSDKIKYPDGFYKIEFSTEDNNGNEGVSEGNYYFLLDRTGPEVSEPQSSVSQSENADLIKNDFSFSWDIVSEDYKGVTIYQREDQNTLSPVVNGAGDNISYNIGDLLEGTEYTYLFRFEDFAGNSTDYEVVKSTLPGKILNVTVEPPTSEGIKVNWDYPDSTGKKNSTVKQAVVYYAKGENPTLSSSFVVSAGKDGNETNGSIIISNDLLEPGCTYNFQVYAQDKNGDCSTVGSEIKSGKSIPRSLNLDDISAITIDNQIKLKWTNPSGNSDHTKIEYCKGASFDEANKDSIDTTAGANEQVIDSLELGSTYSFRLYNVDEDGNISAFVEYKKNTAPVKLESLTLSKTEGKYNESVAPSWAIPATQEATVGKVRVYYSQTPDFGTTAADLRYADSSDGAKTTLDITPSITTMVPGYRYYLKAAIIDEEGNIGVLSDQVAYVVYPRPVVISDIRIPVVEEHTDYTKREITWYAPSCDSALFKNLTYTVEYRTNNTDYVESVHEDTTETTAIVTDLSISSDIHYFFRVNVKYSYADNYITEEGLESQSEDIIISKPTSIALQPVNQSIRVTWSNDNAGIVDGYIVYYGKENDITKMTIGAEKTADASSAVISGLDRGYEYYFTVVSYINEFVSYDAGNAKKADAIKSHYIKPSAPTITSLDSTGNSITVNWRAPADTYFTNYKLLYRESEKSWTSINNIDLDATTYTITGLKSGTQYDVYMIVYTGTYNGYSEYNAAKCESVSEYTKVNTPTITSVTTSGTTATVNWTIDYNSSNDSLNGFKIYYGTTNNIENMTMVHAGGNTTRSCTISNLVPGNNYYFYVVAWSGTYSSYDLSNTALSSVYSKYFMHNAPTNVSITGVNTTSLTLSWTNPTGNYTGVKVYYGTTSSPTTLLATYTNKTTTSYTKTDLTAGTKYYFKVVSYVNNVENSSSVVNQYTKPNGVTGVGLSDSTTTSLKLKWTNPTGNYDGVKVLYGTTQTPTTVWTGTIAKGSTNATITGLSAGTGYYFKVVPYIGTWSSATAMNANPSSVTSVIYTRPNDVNITKFALSSTERATIDLEWSFDGSQKGFHVYVGTENNFDKAVYEDYWNTSHSNSCSYSADMGTRYYYWFVSYAGTEPTRRSTPAQIKALTNVSISPSKEIYIKPNAVKSLRFKGYRSDYISVEWTNPSTAFTGYYFYKKDKTAGDTEVTFVGSSTDTTLTTYGFENLLAGHDYELSVYTYDKSSSGSVIWSNVATCSGYTGIPLQSITLTSPSTKKINVKWDNYAARQNDFGFALFINTTDDFNSSKYLDYWNVKTYSGSTASDYTTYNGSALSSGTTYYVWTVSYIGSTAPRSVSEVNTQKSNRKASVYPTSKSIIVK